jgi:hypothetical protein
MNTRRCVSIYEVADDTFTRTWLLPRKHARDRDESRRAIEFPENPGEYAAAHFFFKQELFVVDGMKIWTGGPEED